MNETLRLALRGFSLLCLAVGLGYLANSTIAGDYGTMTPFGLALVLIAWGAWHVSRPPDDGSWREEE